MFSVILRAIDAAAFELFLDEIDGSVYRPIAVDPLLEGFAENRFELFLGCSREGGGQDSAGQDQDEDDEKREEEEGEEKLLVEPGAAAAEEAYRDKRQKS